MRRPDLQQLQRYDAKPIESFLLSLSKRVRPRGIPGHVGQMSPDVTSVASEYASPASNRIITACEPHSNSDFLFYVSKKFRTTTMLMAGIQLGSIRRL